VIGAVFRPAGTIELQPNIRLRLTVEAAAASAKNRLLLGCRSVKNACFRGFGFSIFRDDLPVLWRNVGKNARRLRPPWSCPGPARQA